MLEFHGLFPVIVSLIVVKLCHSIYRWTNPKCKGKLPPGSMGFPIIGDTFEFMTPYDFSSVVSPYLEKRISRYGSKVFRTSLFGAKVIISTDHEVNMEMAKASTQLSATESLRRLFGENSDFLQRKEIHKYVRNLTSRFVGPENLKTRLIQDIDVLSRNYFKIENGAISSSFDIKEAATKMVVELIVKKVIGEMESEAVKELGLCWTAFRTNWFSFSYNFPGTTVYRFVKATWEALRPRAEEIRWYKNVWFRGGTPKHAFTMWTAYLDRLPTKVRLFSWGLLIPTTCALCTKADEDRDHLFLRCEYSESLWHFAQARLHVSLATFQTWASFTAWTNLSAAGSPSTLRKLVAHTIIYSIWKERNNRFHSSLSLSPVILFKDIDRQVRNSINARRKRRNFRRLMPLWLC